MGISTKQARAFRPTISKIVMACAFASVMGGISMTPALANDSDRHEVHQDRDRHYDHDRHEHRPEYRSVPEYRPVYQHPYYYSQPVYAPPPIYYPPLPSPGVSFFFPLEIRIR
jgi:hypothetical protein